MTDGARLAVKAVASGGTVLVVDDNPATRYSTSRVLQAAGYATREAATGAQALSMADRSIAAVILDIHLPDMNGYEICAILRARSDMGAVPVVHLSAAYMKDDDKVRGLEGGADAYMTHPADPPLLVATVNALVRARRAEQGALRSEARFRTIYELAPGPIALLDASGALIDANAALLGLLKRPADEVVGRPLATFVRPDEAPGVEQYVEAGREGIWSGEFDLVDAAGVAVLLSWTLSPYSEAGGVIAMATDITERVYLSRQRELLLEREQAARADAERVSRVKDEFIAVLSHELRTPLNAILTWAQLLKRSTAQLPRGLDVIERNARTQTRLISDILDVSRMDLGKLRLDLAEIDAADVVASAVSALETSAHDKQITIATRIEPLGVPLVADGARLQQIVWNLLTNAIKFSEAGGRIDVTLHRDGEHAELWVRDGGRGIPADFLAHLFERFSQSDSASNRLHGGLGLGLSIVKHLTELHGGHVRAQSDGEGRGAAFRVCLPLRGPGLLATADEDNDTAFDPLAPSAELAGLDILVVEDDADAREIVALILREQGARVREAADADEALRELRQRRPDALVSDIGLPGRDGHALVRELRQMEQAAPAANKPAVRAVALTAFSRSLDRDNAFAAGFDAHCAKPLQARELIGAILGRSAPPTTRQGRSTS